MVAHTKQRGISPSLLRILRSPTIVAILICALVTGGILTVRHLGKLEPLELAAFDWVLRWRPESGAIDPRIILVTITEPDIQLQGRRPLTDAVLARLVDTISGYAPRAIGLDLYRDIEVPPGHDDLNRALTEHREIIVVTKLGAQDESGIPPPPALRQTDQVGFNDMLLDRGGIVRRGLLFLDNGEEVVYSFGLRLALLYLAGEGIGPQADPTNPEYLRLGRMTFRPFEGDDGGYAAADSRGYQILMDYRGGRVAVPSVTLTDVLSGRVAREVMHDKVVLIGVTAESVPDIFHTPFSHGLHAVRKTYGVELHAYLISQLLRGAIEGQAPIKTATEGEEFWWIILWSVLGIGAGALVRSPWRFSSILGCGLVVLGGIAFFGIVRGWWVPLVPPALAWVTSATVITAYVSNQEREQRALLMQLFSRHVSSEVAESIWEQREEFLDGGRPRPQKMIATVLFTDLKGYTGVSEKMEPRALMDWLNTYMGAMTRLVINHGGVVDDYAGDAIKANFGIPVPRRTEEDQRRDAENAVACAIAMGEALTLLNERWLKEQLPTMGMRVGIYTGPVVAGSLGSEQRLKFTTVGDTVNVASRLESVGKDHKELEEAQNTCRILIGEPTFRYLDERFRTEQVGEVMLKGKDEKIMIYRVLGWREGRSTQAIQEA